MVRSKSRRRLSPEGVTRIVRAIEATDASLALAWKDVQRLASEHAGEGYVWTRQTLERNAKIKAAYHEHELIRKKHRNAGAKGGRRLAESQKLMRLEQQCTELKEALDKYDERFAIYVANAVAYGLTVEQLSTPLSVPSRGSGNSD